MAQTHRGRACVTPAAPGRSRSRRCLHGLRCLPWRRYSRRRSGLAEPCACSLYRCGTVPPGPTSSSAASTASRAYDTPRTRTCARMPQSNIDRCYAHWLESVLAIMLDSGRGRGQHNRNHAPRASSITARNQVIGRDVITNASQVSHDVHQRNVPEVRIDVRAVDRILQRLVHDVVVDLGLTREVLGGTRLRGLRAREGWFVCVREAPLQPLARARNF